MATSVAVLAVHDLRLVGIQPQPDLNHPVLDCPAHELRLAFADAVHHRVVGVMPIAARGRLASRAWWRLAAAMLVTSARRRTPMAALRRTAMTWGPVPVRTWERSFVVGDVPDPVDLFSMDQCPRIQSARCIGLAWRAWRSVMA